MVTEVESLRCHVATSEEFGITLGSSRASGREVGVDEHGPAPMLSDGRTLEERAIDDEDRIVRHTDWSGDQRCIRCKVDYTFAVQP